MTYWRTVRRNALANTRADLSLAHPAKLALAVLTPIVTGALTWSLTGGIAWSAIATVALLLIVGSVVFVVHMIDVPRKMHAETGQKLAELVAAPHDPARDMGLSEALCFAHTGQRGQRPVNIHADAFMDVTAEWEKITQLACDGVIRIWGKGGYGDVYVLIPSEFWQTNRPEWMSVLANEPKTEHLTGKTIYTTYTELMVSSSEIVRFMMA